MPNTKNEVLQVIAGLERTAEESNDINIVRGAYKLIRQIEEFVQLLPEEGMRSNTSSSTKADTSQKARKGKPGRKKMGRPAGKKNAGVSNESQVSQDAASSKKRGRPGRPKQENENTSESAE